MVTEEGGPGGGQDAVVHVEARKRKRSGEGRFSTSSVPHNLHSLSVEQLRAVCASHGVSPRGSCKTDIIDQIEDDLCGEDVEWGEVEVVKRAV